MRRYVDHVLCALPFEQTWFNERGCKATFVGHPFFDEVRRQQFDRAFGRRAELGREIELGALARRRKPDDGDDVAPGSKAAAGIAWRSGPKDTSVIT
ncbi:MAG: hypothetical protein HC779_08635, partial [Phyllobacteriaceae bacterium]|nr:hypothetical protein [Phyllobacteriaceae bacterium]